MNVSREEVAALKRRLQDRQEERRAEADIDKAISMKEHITMCEGSFLPDDYKTRLCRLVQDRAEALTLTSSYS